MAPIDVHLFQDLRSGLRVQVLRDEMALIDAELMKCRGAVCFVKRGDGSSSLPGGAFPEEPLDSLNRHHGPVGVPAGGRRGVSHGAFEATWAGKAREGRNSIANPLGGDEKPKKGSGLNVRSLLLRFARRFDAPSGCLRDALHRRV